MSPVWLKASVLACLLVYSECVYVYSSFYAPLFDRRVLGYRVDARFEPSAGRARATTFANMFGHRGEGLVRRLGTGEGLPPTHYTPDENDAINFYYTT